jgi:hypothetical protein
MNALRSGARLVSEHFARYRRRSPWSFCWRIAIESVVVSFAAALIFVPFVNTEPRTLLELPYYAFFLLGVLIAPLVETVLFQALPVGVMRLLRTRFGWQVLVATALFAAAHFREGVSVGLGAGLVGGFYFAFTYVHWRERSRWTALWTTAVCHGIHNGIAIILLLPYWLSR